MPVIINPNDSVATTLVNITAAVNALAPALGFSALPTIAPSSGAVGTAFTGSDGTFVNGTVAARQWLLNGTAISGATGASYVSASAGNLTYQVTVAAGNIAVSATANAATVTAVPVIPTLTLTGPLTFVSGAVGSLIVNVNNVPAGSTPVPIPNDGRIVTAGGLGAWTFVVGMTQASAGTISLSASATGANNAAAVGVVVTAAGVPIVINSPTTQSQPGGTQRFYQVRATRPFTLTSISSNATIYDAANGIYALKTSAVGDGSVSGSATVTVGVTAADGTTAAQTVTVTLNTIAAPSQLSTSYQSDFTGTAGRNISTLPGWTVSGGSTFNAATDGAGNIVGTGGNANGLGVFQTPPLLANQSATFGISKGAKDYQGILFFVAATDANNGVAIFVYPKDDGPELHSTTLFQGGATTDLGHGAFSPWPASNTGSLTCSMSGDGNTLTVTLNASTATSYTVDLTGKTKGPKLGFAAHDNIDNGSQGIYYTHPVSAVSWAVKQSGLSVVNVPGATPSNVVNVQLAWDTTLAKPTGIQHSQDAGVTWLTGDGTVNNDGTIVYAANTSGAANLPALRFRILNDTGVVAISPNPTRFFARPTKFGANSISSAGWFNPYDPEFQIFDNLFTQGYWQDTTNSSSYDVTGKVDANGMPLVNGLKRQIARGPSSGETLEMTWTGSPSMGFSLTTTQGNLAYGSVTRPTAQSARWTETFAYDGYTPNFGGVTFDGINTANPPKNITIRVLNQATPQNLPFSDAFVSFNATFNGPIRLMDVLNTNQRVDGSATFAQDKSLVQMAITLGNATGRDIWWNIPIYASDAYITAVAQALVSGTGTSNGIGLNSSLNVWFEWGNEVWNGGAFQAYSILKNKYCARTGQTALADNAGGANQVYAEHAYQHNHAMSVIEAAVSASRVVRVVGTQRGTYHYETFKSSGGVHYDAVAQAPYFTVSSNPDQTPAALGVTWKAAALSVLNDLNTVANEIYADGKRFVCYEGGPDYTTSGVTQANWSAFKASQAFYDVMRAYYQAWSDQYGDVFCQYTDLGLDTWSIYQYQGVAQPSGYNALIDTIAGNSAHRPVVAIAAPALVNSASTPATSSYSSTTTVTLAVTKGNLICAGIFYNGSGGTASVTDTAGNSYTVLTSLDSGTTESNFAYAMAATTGTITLTWTLVNSASSRSLSVAQFSGSYNVFDNKVDNTFTAGNSTKTTGPITTSQPNQLAVIMEENPMATIDSGGTIIQTPNYSTLAFVTFANPVTGTVVNFTAGGTDGQQNRVVVFKHA